MEQCTEHPEGCPIGSHEGTVKITAVDPETKEITVEPSPHAAAPPSAEPEPIRKPTPAEGTGDSRDTDKVDSLGTEKGDQTAGEAHDPLAGTGPRGANVSPEHLSEAKKVESTAAEQKRLQKGMSSSDFVDSIGNKQGEFVTEAQGLDKHGARIPDKITDELKEPPPPMIGPRGHHAPPESFHGKRR